MQPHVGIRIFSCPDFAASQPGFDEDGDSGGDHAGKVETSLLWAIEPASVDVSRLPPEDASGPHFAMGKTARLSNRRVGERMVRDEVAWLGAKAEELLGAYAKEQPAARLRTFDDVERLWADVVRPNLPTFKTKQNTWGDCDDLPEKSVWRENAPITVER